MRLTLGKGCRKLRAWQRAGAHRRDLDRDGTYEHSEAIRIMDAWWPRWIAAEFRPVLGRKLFESIQTIDELSNDPNNHGDHLGSAWGRHAPRTYSQSMDGKLFARAAAAQLACVAVLFVLLVALPLPADFFRDYGAVTGPTAWVLSAAVATRLLGLPVRTGITAALLSGVAAGLVGVAIDHTLGLVVGVLAFGAVCAALRIRKPAPMV